MFPQLSMNWLPKSVVCLRYYDRFRFRSDLFASSLLTLQIFPTSSAIAIASGLSPLYGLSCAAIATLVASGFGDSKVRISGPSILFTAAVSSMVTRHGLLGLSLSTLSAGLLLAFFGAIGLGAIQTIPRPVIVGLSTGIAAVVVGEQLVLGIGLRASVGEAGWGLRAALRDFTKVDAVALTLGLATLILIVASKRIFRHIPAGLLAMAAGALLVRLGYIPLRTLDGATLIPFTSHLPLALRPGLFGSVLSQSFAIAVLVAVESLQAMDLVSARTAEQASANGELVVQGGANVACAFAGGLPTCGISSYSADNALLGAQTPMSGILQSAFLVGFLFLLAPLLPFVPLPVISAIIFSEVCGMTHWEELPQMIGSRGTGVAAWLTVAVLTIVDLAMGVAVGLLIAMFLHVRKHRALRLGETL